MSELPADERTTAMAMNIENEMLLTLAETAERHSIDERSIHRLRGQATRCKADSAPGYPA
ncbi:MAG: hypothetical protein A2Y13_02830 [Planctomycetes bacterium GWC2_45_44]|nr:MAG: hypothetical protein A2Y13_02830 [Planctomycetes bacterium GWC2_45_44]HBR19405.1 hypothetical protein [Phycisphaerales bacterium]